jgi:hypothetical protein
MLAVLLLAGYGVLRAAGGDEEPDEPPVRRAYDLIANEVPEVDCDEVPEVCRELMDSLATTAAEDELPGRGPELQGR